jgi:hypothetical protein
MRGRAGRARKFFEESRGREAREVVVLRASGRRNGEMPGPAARLESVVLDLNPKSLPTGRYPTFEPMQDNSRVKSA